MVKSVIHIFWHTEPFNKCEAAQCSLNDSACRELLIQWTVHRTQFRLVNKNIPILTLMECDVCYGNKSMRNWKNWMTLRCHTSIQKSIMDQEAMILKLNYEGHLESKERFAIQRYLLIIGKKKNMQVLWHTFTYFST